jgi:hypothetical protein
MQTIYYPGFTLAGIAEVGSILMLTPQVSVQFWLVLAALASLVAVQVIFWTLTQPLNKYCFRTRSSRARPRASLRAADWTAMRNRWERSHVLALSPPCWPLAADHGRCAMTNDIAAASATIRNA